MIATTRLRSLSPLAALLLVSAVAQAQATKAPATSKPQEKAKAGAPAAAPAGPIDVNSATTEELTTLPGIGEAYARKIIESRPHKSVDDLAAAGVPAATVAKLKGKVVARPLPTAVEVNTATSERLQTLPNVGPTLAKAIIEGRPYRSYDDLAKVRGIGPAKLDDLRGRLAFGGAGETTAQKVKAAAGATKGAVKANAENAKAEMKDRAADAKARIGDAASKTKAAAGEAASKTKAAASDAAGKAKSKVGEAADRVREKADASKEKAETSKPKLAPGQKININTATKDELDELFGIGPVRAQAIIDARPFAKPEDIMKVKGIKEGEYAKIKDHIVVK